MRKLCLCIYFLGFNFQIYCHNEYQNQFLVNRYKHMDLRVLIVLGPIVLVAAWAAFNLGKAVIKGEASLFGKQGNNPFQ